MRSAIGFGVMVVAAGAVLGCSRASDESEAHEWQSPLPRPGDKEVPIPDGLAIALTVDGAARPAITSETLRAAKPDFADPDHKAWRIPTLVPEAGSGASVEAGGTAGISVKFELATAAATQDGFQPVLFLTRRGDVIAAAVDPKEPFPRYHGQGGRLHRPGDAIPHVEKVNRVTVTRPATR